MNLYTIENGLADSLKKEFKCEDLNFCLVKIGILEDGESVISYQDVEAWERGGAETYVSSANIITNKKKLKIIAKALFSIAIKPEQQLNNWVSRRIFLQRIGINTPKLFSALNGVIYEEFIDNIFFINSNLPKSLLEQIAFIAGQLDKNGFTTLSFINDLRHKENTLYYVDFGSDLGAPSSQKTNCAINLLSRKLTDEQLLFIQPIYDSIKN